MHKPITFLVTVALLFTSLCAETCQAAKARVEMDVVMDSNMASASAGQKWAKVLNDAGIANVRFRSLQNGDQVKVTTQGAGDAAVVHITAQLKQNGTILTPSGQFTTSDVARLKKWLDDLSLGNGLPGQRKTVFGLTAKQFDETKLALSTPVTLATKDVRPEKVIEQIRGTLTIPLSIDPDIEKAIAADDPVRDELKGISVGTAMAAIVRPAGGVLLPRAGDKGIELMLAKPQAAGEMWPIGWPPDEKDESKVLPILYQFVPVEIDGVPAADAVTALQTRLNVPFLFDYNNLARGKVNLKKPVKLTPGKSFYRKILDSVLFQAGLKAELRVDDAGAPLLWITIL